MFYKASNIRYDTDGDTKLAATLPPSLVVEVAAGDNPEDAISDAISDCTGFCHFGFDFVRLDNS